MPVESAGMTDVGLARERNEDALLVDDGMGLYLVADGMGGHRAGDVASRLVVETIEHAMRGENGAWPDGDEPEPDPALSPEANRLVRSILLANRTVHARARQGEACRGMGSNVAALYLAGETLIAANVGDSPVFLVREGRPERLSVPHTVLAEASAAGPGVEPNPPAGLRHLLTRAVGVEPTVEVDICEMPCLKGDRLVLCSDGLSGKLTEEEIARVASGEPPAEACRTLVELANERGGEDNVTVVVLDVQPRSARRRRVLSLLSRWAGGRGSRSR